MCSTCMPACTTLLYVLHLYACLYNSALCAPPVCLPVRLCSMCSTCMPACTTLLYVLHLYACLYDSALCASPECMPVRLCSMCSTCMPACTTLLYQFLNAKTNCKQERATATCRARRCVGIVLIMNSWMFTRTFQSTTFSLVSLETDDCRES